MFDLAVVVGVFIWAMFHFRDKRVREPIPVLNMLARRLRSSDVQPGSIASRISTENAYLFSA